MCVGLPAKIVTMKDGMAVVDASGAKREISTELLENVEPGDYVMVHAGNLPLSPITGSTSTMPSRFLQVAAKRTQATCQKNEWFLMKTTYS